MQDQQPPAGRWQQRHAPCAIGRPPAGARRPRAKLEPGNTPSRRKPTRARTRDAGLLARAYAPRNCTRARQ
eukprot:11198651-Lingulodinium_polyedra.AAC.1